MHCVHQHLLHTPQVKAYGNVGPTHPSSDNVAAMMSEILHR